MLKAVADPLVCLVSSRRVEPKKSQTTAKILEALVKIDQRIDAQKIAAVDKEEGKEISLTTSKINYMGEPEPGFGLICKLSLQRRGG